MTDIVERLRKYHREIVEIDGGECPAMEMTRVAADEIERLRQELRRPMGCTYDSEGRPLTVCHELATLRAILAEARARLVDAYGERCAEFDQDCDGCQTWGLIDRMDAAFAGTAGQLATDRDSEVTK